MMKYIHYWMNNVASRLMMVAMLVMGGIATAQAATKLYIDDFSIKPGETKEVAVNLDTDQDNLYYVSLTIDLPEGLSFDKNGNEIALTPNNQRINGFMLAGNKDGKIILNSISPNDVIKGAAGALFTFKVKAASNFEAYGDYIEFDSYRVRNANEKDINVTVKDGRILEPALVQVSFSNDNFTVKPGESFTVGVEMENEDIEVGGFQANIDAPEGWTFSVINSDRMTNGGSNDRVMTTNGITGESGTIFSVRFTAPASFTGSAVISLKDIIASISNEDWDIDDISLTVNADESGVPAGFTMYFAQEFAAAAPNEEIVLDVNLNNAGLTVQGFQANLVIPEGWTYSVRGTDRMSNAGSDDLVMNFSGVNGSSGTIFQIVLTAPATFSTGTATVKVVKALGTVNKKDRLLDDIELTIKAKNPADLAKAMGWVDGLQEKLDATIAKIEKEYPEAAEDEDIIREEQNIQQGINDLHSDVDAAYAKGELNPNDFADEVKELSDAIDALEYNAKEIQDNAGNKENEAGKKALDDEIAELQKKLDDAVASQPKDLPKAATKEISDAADAIQKDIDALKAQVEKDYEDGKLTADSKLDPAKKQAILDAIDALKAQIAKWLRGDVDNDGDVDMADFYALKKLISDEKTPKADEDANAFYRCDANADGEINVGDLQGILNICIGLNANGK